MATCALSDVSVKVRSVRSNKTVESYTFLDPGSIGTSCMEELVRGKKEKGQHSAPHHGKGRYGQYTCYEGG